MQTVHPPTSAPTRPPTVTTYESCNKTVPTPWGDSPLLHLVHNLTLPATLLRAPPHMTPVSFTLTGKESTLSHRRQPVAPHSADYLLITHVNPNTHASPHLAHLAHLDIVQPLTVFSTRPSPPHLTGKESKFTLSGEDNGGYGEEEGLTHLGRALDEDLGQVGQHVTEGATRIWRWMTTWGGWDRRDGRWMRIWGRWGGWDRRWMRLWGRWGGWGGRWMST